MRNTFNGTVAIVTGGASGIGCALSKGLCMREAMVVVADVNFAGAKEVASGIVASGGRAIAADLDVSRREAVVRVIEETAAQHGRLDYMFNNAGITIQGEVRDATQEHWRRIIDINFNGVLNGTITAYSVMVKQGFGHIVNTSSIAGLMGMSTTALYSTTKHAIIGLSTSLRAEGAALGVKVSVVCPGWVDTGIYEAATVLKVDRAALFAQIPFKKLDPDRAACEILKGVARNKEFIVFPFHARMFWWAWRIHPSLIGPINRETIQRYRKLCSDQSARS